MENRFFNTAGNNPDEEDSFDPIPLAEDAAPCGYTAPSIEKPKRPLSAYNLFFQSERRILLAELPPRAGRQPRKSHGKIGFKEMATIIGKRWRELDDVTRAPFLLLAKQEKNRHGITMENYRRRLREQENQDASVSSYGDDIHPIVGPPNSSDLSDLARRLGPDMVELLVATFK